MSASLNNIVDVSVEVSNVSVISSNFSLGLIIGSSTALQSDVLKVYNYDTYQTQMVTDGFKTTDPEYLAAQLYFSQSSKPAQVAIGYQGSSQEPVAALQACRGKNEDFYVVCFTSTMTDEQALAVSAYVESSSTPTLFIHNISDLSAADIGEELKTTNYTRSVFFVSTNANICPAVMGLFCGLSTLTANSAFAMIYKTLSGVTPDSVTDSDVQEAVDSKVNVYGTFGRNYSFVYPAVTNGGYAMDEILLIDAAKSLIQQYVISGLVSANKIPMSESGMSMITSYISRACEILLSAGFITGGIWKGANILNLSTGDAISNGYYIQHDSIASLTAEEKASRQAPPFYVALISSGAIESVVVKVYLER